jgi:hypothetical protein
MLATIFKLRGVSVIAQTTALNDESIKQFEHVRATAERLLSAAESIALPKWVVLGV